MENILIEKSLGSKNNYKTLQDIIELQDVLENLRSRDIKECFKYILSIQDL